MKVLGTLQGETTDTGYIGSIGVVAFSNGIRLDDRITMTKGQAHGLMSILREYFKADPPKNGQFEFIDCGPIAPKDGPAEDTVALLCAAAREWAKWDAREQAAIDEPDMSVFNFASKKALRYRDRTLSYGHHLLSAGGDIALDSSMKSVLDAQQKFEAELATKPWGPKIIPAPCRDAELNRLDTLVENLRGRLAAVELSIGMEKRG